MVAIRDTPAGHRGRRNVVSELDVRIAYADWARPSYVNMTHAALAPWVESGVLVSRRSVTGATEYRAVRPFNPLVECDACRQLGGQEACSARHAQLWRVSR